MINSRAVVIFLICSTIAFTMSFWSGSYPILRYPSIVLGVIGFVGSVACGIRASRNLKG